MLMAMNNNGIKISLQSAFFRVSMIALALISFREK
jgi:hypothetical protein